MGEDKAVAVGGTRHGAILGPSSGALKQRGMSCGIECYYCWTSSLDVREDLFLSTSAGCVVTNHQDIDGPFFGDCLRQSAIVGRYPNIPDKPLPFKGNQLLKGLLMLQRPDHSQLEDIDIVCLQSLQVPVEASLETTRDAPKVGACCNDHFIAMAGDQSQEPTPHIEIRRKPWGPEEVVNSLVECEF